MISRRDKEMMKTKKCTACDKKLPESTEHFPALGVRRADGSMRLRATCRDCFNTLRRGKRLEASEVSDEGDDDDVLVFDETPDPVARYEASRKESQLRAEHKKLVEQVREERARNAFVDELSAQKTTPKIIRSEKKSGLRECTALVVGSDWHVEETVTLESSGGKNEWNLAIADKSVKRFFRAAVDLVEHNRASGKLVIRDMVLALIGDLFSGHIHDELVEITSLTPIEVSLWLAPRLRDGIMTLLNELDLRSLKLLFGYGNHGRTTKFSRIATGALHSYEWLIGKQLQRELAHEKRIEWDINPTMHQFCEVYDFTIHTHHGDSLSYQGGVGGLTIPFRKAIDAWNSERFAHYHFIGHFHDWLDLDNGMVNGSMIGWNPYSRWIKARYKEPRQIFTLIDSKRGRCITNPIWTRGDDTKIAAG